MARISVAVAWAWLLGCSAAQPEVSQPATGGSRPPASALSGESQGSSKAVDAARPGAAGEPSSLDDSPSAAPAKSELAPEPAACPSEMVLVEGDYCTEVKHQCLKHWFSKANKKKVCEQFAPTAECTGERQAKRYCIDRYSWPNQAGVRPEVMNNFYQAQVKCAAVGKRLCTESEWTMACEGPELKPFPYGFVRDSNKCNGDREWDRPNMKKVAARDPAELARLWQGVPSGSQPMCVSDYGVHDLPGNNDEVVASETYSSGFRGKFDSVHTGGPWYRGVRNQCRPKIYTHNEGFYYYFLGFRCCAAPDGGENDPRTPKQIKRNWKFERIERLARFNREEMREKLKLKEAGQCSCKPKQKLCKTMCGTLLGPQAEDAKLDSPRSE